MKHRLQDVPFSWDCQVGRPSCQVNREPTGCSLTPPPGHCPAVQPAERGSETKTKRNTNKIELYFINVSTFAHTSFRFMNAMLDPVVSSVFIGFFIRILKWLVWWELRHIIPISPAITASNIYYDLNYKSIHGFQLNDSSGSLYSSRMKRQCSYSLWLPMCAVITAVPGVHFSLRDTHSISRWRRR